MPPFSFTISFKRLHDIYRVHACITAENATVMELEELPRTVMGKGWPSATVQRIFNPGVFKAAKSTHRVAARVRSSISWSSGTHTDRSLRGRASSRAKCPSVRPSVAKPGRLNRLTTNALIPLRGDSARSLIFIRTYHRYRCYCCSSLK